MKAAVSFAGLALAALAAGGCMVVRTDPVGTDAYQKLVLAPGATPHAPARPTAFLWATEKPFGSDERELEQLEDEQRAPLLAVVRASGWFSAVSLGGQGEPGERVLEARYHVQTHESMDLYQIPSRLTLGLIPERSRTLVELDLRVLDPAGRILGEATRAEGYSSWRGWIFLPLAPFFLEGDARAAVRADLLRATLADARLAGWL